MIVSKMLTFAEFSAKSHVQRACTTPFHPESVLSFFFDANYFDCEHTEPMRTGAPLKALTNLWYFQSDEYDSLCQPFGDVVKSIGNGDMVNDALWNGSVDGKMSQLILCDQLARNCFRGTDEAFAHGEMAETITLELLDEYNNKDEASRKIPGEFYLPYVSFMLVSLMHSEDIKHHEMALDLVESMRDGCNDEELFGVFDLQKNSALEHKAVLDKFGRYPHRNAKLGRENTPEEQAWLDDKDSLPGWAKSQG